jgi:hypothetical protein
MWTIAEPNVLPVGIAETAVSVSQSARRQPSAEKILEMVHMNMSWMIPGALDVVFAQELVLVESGF